MELTKLTMTRRYDNTQQYKVEVCNILLLSVYHYFEAGIPHLRPAEYKRAILFRNRTVNRAYGGVLSGRGSSEPFGERAKDCEISSGDPEDSFKKLNGRASV
ncbi:hypothetical protein AQUCO_02000461v1 [Aquilegia coerulea]|uniref:Uncharacterized protein n=1 Tax=Aquilegia coerulea TaxID=218851 RepID=A0A2G5DHQ4_AQUCA|nr:hypothetical protein AQUCO_02000461v1 [Aquilegia coerulea]